MYFPFRCLDEVKVEEEAMEERNSDEGLDEALKCVSIGHVSVEMACCSRCNALRADKEALMKVIGALKAENLILRVSAVSSREELECLRKDSSVVKYGIERSRDA